MMISQIQVLLRVARSLFRPVDACSLVQFLLFNLFPTFPRFGGKRIRRVFIPLCPFSLMIKYITTLSSGALHLNVLSRLLARTTADRIAVHQTMLHKQEKFDCLALLGICLHKMLVLH